jgi:hypothetical protein
MPVIAHTAGVRSSPFAPTRTCGHMRANTHTLPLHLYQHTLDAHCCRAGCFDREEDAARAYDRMMLWVEMHGAGPATKAGVTNFDVSQYAEDLPWLAGVTQVGRLVGQGRAAYGCTRVCLSVPIDSIMAAGTIWSATQMHLRLNPLKAARCHSRDTDANGCGHGCPAPTWSAPAFTPAQPQSHPKSSPKQPTRQPASPSPHSRPSRHTHHTRTS